MFDSNYSRILYRFQDEARYWSKIAILSYPTCIRRPLLGYPSECCHEVWYAKTRMVWLYRRWKKFENMFTCFDTIHERERHPTGQTDGQTDTARRHRPCVCRASRGNDKANIIIASGIVTLHGWRQLIRRLRPADVADLPNFGRYYSAIVCTELAANSPETVTYGTTGSRCDASSVTLWRPTCGI